MKRICLSIVFPLIIVGYSFSQEKPVSTEQFSSNWYQLTIGDSQKIKIYPSFWVIELDEAGEYQSSARRDTVFVDDKLSETLLVVKRTNRDSYTLIRRTLENEEAEIHFALLAMSDDKDSLLKRKTEFTARKDYEIANTRVIYNEERKDEIESMPGLDEITSNHLKTVLKKRLEWAPLLKEYLSNNPSMNTNPYTIYRLAQAVVERSFIEQGYNPYKQVVYNFEKTFKDDPEIIKLLSAEL